jgi:hypothetical protein
MQTKVNIFTGIRTHDLIEGAKKVHALYFGATIIDLREAFHT